MSYKNSQQNINKKKKKISGQKIHKLNIIINSYHIIQFTFKSFMPKGGTCLAFVTCDLAQPSHKICIL